jgi:competence protein ComEC
MRQLAVRLLIIITACFAIIGLADVQVIWAQSGDQVRAIDAVVTRVIVRESATTQSPDIGSLRPGERAELTGSVPNWYEVRLANGIDGFVSKRWTQIEKPAQATVSGAANTFTVDVVDVGTGLGILVRGPHFTLVYDAGSNDDRARGDANRMLAFIRAVSPDLTTIDDVILSHPHNDHVDLLPDLFAQYAVKQVWDSGRLNDICGYRAFLVAVRDEPHVLYHTAAQDGGTRSYPFGASRCYGEELPAEVISVPVASRIDNMPVTLGPNASMTILHADSTPHGNPNENSLVTRLDLGTHRILLMGDAEAGGRRAPSSPPTNASLEGVLLRCCRAALAADVMVVGHHGSESSSRAALLAAVKPSIMVISAGPFPYSGVVLPDDVIVQEMKRQGQLFRTDVNDASCGENPSKIGPDSDRAPGGCDNVRLSMSPNGITAGYWRFSDN